MSEELHAQHLLVDHLLAKQPLPAGDEHPCPYLPGQFARNEGFAVDELEPTLYRALMDRGFRRSGPIVYRPNCAACHACQPLRVLVSEFRASRSQRRVWRRNQDLSVTLQTGPEPSDEKWQLFDAYLASRHDGRMVRSRREFVDFLYHSPITTVEFCYRLGRNLVGVGIADAAHEALSSVYMYFDPRVARRGLGTFSILWEIDYCRRTGVPYYYLGYYIADCPKMSYKARFGPHEILDQRRHWRRPAEAGDA